MTTASAPPSRFAVLVSGAGSNLQALLDAQSRGDLAPARVELVVSNNARAKALSRAQQFSVATDVIDHRDHESRSAFEAELVARLQRANIQAVVLAGFMRVLGATFLEGFRGPVINTHPALCPAFPGMRAPQQALDYGAKISGCTIHFVDAGVDTGPIIAQESLAIADEETPESLQRRIQQLEHRLLPRAVHLLASGKLHLSGRQVIIDGGSNAFEQL